MDSPNILVIQADQHRADCIGAYGNSDIKTPHIDALAADGVRYANSFCPYPVCTPSRYSFVSGLYVRQHLGGSNHCTLPTGLPTFPKVLRQAGYTTKAVGKMHLTPTYADIGFDELLLAEQNGAGRYDDYYHRWLRDEGVGYFVDLVDQEREYRQHAPDEYWQHVGALVSDLDEAHHSTTWIAERALDEVKSWDGGGHLLMASFIKPHHPFDPPASWADRYDPAALALLPGYTPQPQRQDLAFSKGYFPSDEMTEAKIRRAMAYYYATISQIDHHVGRLIAQLQRAGYLRQHADSLQQRSRRLYGLPSLVAQGQPHVRAIDQGAAHRQISRPRAGGCGVRRARQQRRLRADIAKTGGLPSPGNDDGLRLGQCAAARAYICRVGTRAQLYGALANAEITLLSRRDTLAVFRSAKRSLRVGQSLRRSELPRDHRADEGRARAVGAL